jgi:4-diphosphocytidyl-2-C-methyl-D-erythritol kinase
MTDTRRARVRAFAKINLHLRVLHRRADGFHELRTVFQTISLGDRIGVEVVPGGRASVRIAGSVEIPDNLMERASWMVMEATGVEADVRFELNKRIPMGAGLGGGSSDAATVLLALPPLLGAALPLERLMALGAALGSDVPFFLLGGTAVGLGRGTELYPLPDTPMRHGVLVAPGIHVSTRDAFQALGRGLTTGLQDPTMEEFQTCVWRMVLPGSDVGLGSGAEWDASAVNDFEDAVFRPHPELGGWKQRLLELGAQPALMTGSGSALFGLLDSPAAARRVCQDLSEVECLPFRFISRTRYRALWRRALREHTFGEAWPPQNRCLNSAGTPAPALSKGSPEPAAGTGSCPD